ncbi:MAG: nicotinate phosphoribosyltransferase, partial [Gemmatales bacterium]|nr:nicotinate phosphoribosyltransferase [Gemmatales bacterium]MDW8387101.1 nicotinate phosphoribosyltransferase [Gemmatales bacterium]
GWAGRQATFELWVRRLPTTRNFLVFAGLDQVLHYLTNLTFEEADLAYLRSLPIFQRIPSGWFDHLRQLRFSGDVWAVPEGTIVFPNEPLLRITAPLEVAQMIETCLLTSISVQTIVATKAARCVLAAQGRSLIDFGARRAHGPEAGLLAARAAYLAGFLGTSLVEAGRRFNIPVFGTQAHSWITAHEQEIQAFAHFADLFPDHATHLVDTYDVAHAVRGILAAGIPVHAVRLDSGDLLALSREVRRLLDEAGRSDVKIMASGDLNEYKIRDLLAADAPIDGFGVGTELVTSRDDPTLSSVYKLVEIDGENGRRGVFKLSPGKQTLPRAKQVWRQTDAAGRWLGDVVGLAEELMPGEPLLKPVMLGGKLVEPLPGLEEARRRCREQLSALPDPLRSLEASPTPYPVSYSQPLLTAASFAGS